jgi:hypothetical protein
MKILSPEKAYHQKINRKYRRVTIGFYLIYCDIYPDKHATLRPDKNERFDKAAPLHQDSFHPLLEFPVALFHPDDCHRYAVKNHHFLAGILSLTKPGPDSYPADSTINSYYTKPVMAKL